MVKAKRKADGEIIDVSSVEYTNVETNVKSRYCSKDGKMYPLSDLDFLPEKETAVLEGFVARDEEGYISLFPDKPERDMYDCNDITYGFWDEANGHHIELPTDSFPSVTWQSEPKRVRIKIEEIEG